MLELEHNLWDDSDAASEPKPEQALLTGMILWLRTYDRDGPTWIGLENMINILVPFSNDLKLGLNVPEFPADHIISSAGGVAYVPGVGNSMRFLWSNRSVQTCLDLELYGFVHISHLVHLRWIEWAMAWALFYLHKAGKQWSSEQHGQFKVKVIGGMEVADFL